MLTSKGYSKTIKYMLLFTLHEKMNYQRCIDVLLAEVYKCLNVPPTPKLMNKVFYMRQNHYNVSSLNVFTSNNPHNKSLLNSAIYGTNQLWQSLPFEVNNQSITTNF